MRRPITLATVLALLFLAGCGTGNEVGTTPDPPQSDVPQPDFEESDPPPAEDIVSDIGRVQYVDLEGGFYGIVTEDGTRYNPLNLEAAYQEDGITVRFRGVRQEDVVTIQMWGTPLRLMEIERVEVGEY